MNTLGTGQKQVSPAVTMSNEITKMVRSDNAEFRTGKTGPQPVAMSDNRGLWQQVCKEAGLLDVRYETPASLNTAGQQRSLNPQFPSADS